ncbi:MAG: type II toxin-antitoxin system VapC family toxin [Chloroflexota bacterium]|nr:type II toxin-antitoxin system VapC family toxin [Chloroflexota bacterium]
MAIYIVDASIVAERLIRGHYTENARAMFNRMGLLDELIVPEFCLIECTNVIWKHVRYQGMQRSQADLTLRDLRALPLKQAGVKSILSNALDIGLRHQLAVYDSLYVALAIRLQVPFISIDGPQQRAATAEGVILKPITDFT